MITLIVGENLYMRNEKIREITHSFHGAVERIDGGDVTSEMMADLFIGATLFASDRLIVIDRLSDNTAAWNALQDWVDKISQDTQVVLVENTIDKRTKTYKAIKKLAQIIEVNPLGYSDKQSAIAWLDSQCKKNSLKLDRQTLQSMIDRALIQGDKPWVFWIDQAVLSQAISALSVIDNPKSEHVDAVLPPSKHENSFALFDAALSGDAERLKAMFDAIKATEIPQRLIGMLSNQIFQLSALVTSDQPLHVVARDIGAQPFVLEKLTQHAARLNRQDMSRIVALYADADERMKTSAGEPWQILWHALVATAK